MSQDPDWAAEWLRWKALASVVAVPAGFGAIVGLAFVISQYWPYSKDATIQAAATVIGAIIAFGGISWQIRTTFTAQERQRQQSRADAAARAARPIEHEMTKNVSILVEILKLNRADLHRGWKLIGTMLSRAAFERGKATLDDLDNPDLVSAINSYYTTLDVMLDLAKADSATFTVPMFNAFLGLVTISSEKALPELRRLLQPG